MVFKLNSSDQQLNIMLSSIEQYSDLMFVFNTTFKRKWNPFALNFQKRIFINPIRKVELTEMPALTANNKPAKEDIGCNNKSNTRMKRKPMFDKDHNFLNGVKLTFERGFGFSQDPQMDSSAHCIDDNKIVYCLGKQIIQYDMLTENQKVVDSIDQQEQITSFKYFKNLMLDDNILYTVHAANKTYPSIVLKNYSKNLTQRLVMAHLEKEERIVRMCLMGENKYVAILSVLEGTYRLSYVQILTKEIVATDSIYFKVLGMFVPEASPKSVILYTANEIYAVEFGLQIKPVALGLNRHLNQKSSDASSKKSISEEGSSAKRANESNATVSESSNGEVETIVEAISSVFTNNDVQIYLITSSGFLVLINANLDTLKIEKVERLFLGTFQTARPHPTSSQVQTVTRNRMPSSICCNEYSIIIGYHFIEEFSLIKICPIMATSSSVSSANPQSPTSVSNDVKSSLKIERVPFSCPNLHKSLRMQFAHETMSICVIVQVKENDRHDLSIPIQSEYLKEKQSGVVAGDSLLSSGSNNSSSAFTSRQSNTNYENHLAPPGKIFPVVFNMLLHDTLVETLRSPIQSILGWMLFVKEIMDIAILPTKKIMLILSKERKIKAVKYEHLSSTSFERMLLWEMHFNHNDFPSSLDVHPLTFNVAVGFREGLKLFTISSEGLKPNNIQFPLKNCEAVKYSKFGHKLIAGSSNQIIVIDPYENKILNTINLNSGYNTKELLFIDRDMYIFSQFSNGSSMILNGEGNKIFEVAKKESKVITSAYDSVFDIMVVSYGESSTKFYRERGTQDFGVLWTYPFNITKILIVNELGTIFLGTSLGKIRAYQWPFTDMMRFKDSFTELQLHSAPITKIKIIHDYSLLITGAEDGSIFISKINAYSDGIAISDAEIMHSLKSGNKNFTNLFYLQNYMITSSAIEFAQEETVVQLESDKADFQTEYSEVIMGIESQIDEKLKNEESAREQEFKTELEGREQEIQRLNQEKISIKDEANEIAKKKASETALMEEAKLETMRRLYKESDVLKAEKEEQIKRYEKEIEQQKGQHQRELGAYRKQLKAQEDELLREIAIVEKEHRVQQVNYSELMKEEQEEGVIYMNRMLEELEAELELSRETGEKLRKNYNKIRHDNQQQEEKLKAFQQMLTEHQIDTEAHFERHADLKAQEKYLNEVLATKDREIREEEKNVKELLSKNINNYTHEEYLKHRQEELLEKVDYLEQELLVLDEKYHKFQSDFVEVSAESSTLNSSIEDANAQIAFLKQKGSQEKQLLYAKKYRNRDLINRVDQAFHDSKCDKAAYLQKVKQIFSQVEQSSEKSGREMGKQSVSHPSPATDSGKMGTEMTQSSEDKINQRDHLIKQVVNTNNLRKIDDTIRRTIMIKLNRETVSLTCEVNELRKEKKRFSSRINELRYYIKDLKEILGEDEKENRGGHGGDEEQDIVPANISVIRSKPSKHMAISSTNRQSEKSSVLPFQLYHQNKQASKLSCHHSRTFNKDLLDESSTQLPSFLPSILKNNSISEESSRMMLNGTGNDDSILGRGKW